MNAVEIEQTISELAIRPFDAAEFPYAFLAAFGNKEVTLKHYSAHSRRLDFRGNFRSEDSPINWLRADTPQG